MFNTLNRAKSSVLYAAFLVASNACRFAAEATEAAATGTVTAGNSPASSKATRKVIQPTVDIAEMSDTDVRSLLAKMMADRARLRDVTKTIRFNDGTEGTLQWEDEAKTKPKIDPTTRRQVGSARDSGTFSVYGFGRQPISLYSNQWLELLSFGPDIVEAIASKVDHVNEYIRSRNNGKVDRDVNEDLVLQLQELYHTAQYGTEVVGGSLEGNLADGAEAPKEDDGIIATLEGSEV